MARSLRRLLHEQAVEAMKRNDGGFTLIEMMIVVAIVAILAAIAFSLYPTYTAKTKISNALGSLAGERIKIGTNWNDGLQGVDLCDGVAEDARLDCESGAILIGDNMSIAASDTQVRVTPQFPTSTGNRITWVCVVQASPVPGYVGDPCERLTPTL